jgi:PAS domain-containing protein
MTLGSKNLLVIAQRRGYCRAIMSRVPVQFLDESFHRVLFDAIPIPVLVVDEDVSILEYNAAAAKLIGRNKRLVLTRRSGEVLHCIHAVETPEGCGRVPACSDCVVRQSVDAAAKGQSVSRRWAWLELVENGKARKVNLRVSTQPFTCQRHSFILLMLEGLND